MPRSRSLAELLQQGRATTAPAPSTAAGGPGFAHSQSQGMATGGSSGGSGVGKQLVKSVLADESKSKAVEGALKKEEGSGIGGDLMKAWLLCWVAAEYYSRDSTDWLRCRNWVLTHPRLTYWYAEHGSDFANFLRTHPICRRLFQPVVLFARWRGQL